MVYDSGSAVDSGDAVGIIGTSILLTDDINVGRAPSFCGHKINAGYWLSCNHNSDRSAV